MQRHIFLTGEKQIGKSTLLQKLLASTQKEYGGFFTKRILSAEDGLFYTHLLRPGELPCPDNVLFCCNGPNPYDPVERFEVLGCAALCASAGCPLIVMDELGPHEETAFRFQEKVLELLDGQVPILGVLQKAESPFLQKIAAHPSVRIITVNKENRSSLSAGISFM